MDWFPWYPTDFRRDTYHLSLAEDGAYRRLIDEYMITRETLPGDDDALARIVGISRAEWDSIKPRVKAFFKERNGRLWHKRCASEMNAQDAKKLRNSEKGKKAAFKRYSKINGMNASTKHQPARGQDKVNLTTFTDGAPKGAAEEEFGHNQAQPAQPLSTTAASSELARINQRKGWVK